MAKWNIELDVRFSAEGIEADTEEDAWDLFLGNREMYYDTALRSMIEGEH
jgi:hypothetical protein